MIARLKNDWIDDDVEEKIISTSESSVGSVGLLLWQKAIACEVY